MQELEVRAHQCEHLELAGEQGTQSGSQAASEMEPGEGNQNRGLVFLLSRVWKRGWHSFWLCLHSYLLQQTRLGQE